MHNFQLILSIALHVSGSCIIPPPTPVPEYCPHDQTMDNFVMPKMLGEWFVYETVTTNPTETENLSKPVPCQVFNITNSEDSYLLTSTWGDDQFKFIFNYRTVQEDRILKTISKTSLSTEKSDIDTTTFLNDAVDEIKFSVLATDYQNIAVVFTCEQERAYTRRVYILRRIRRANTISRREKILIGNMYTKLYEYGFDLDILQEVDQENC